jgi:hypothetical protein
VRALVVLAAAGAALAVVSPSAAADRVVERGIVQSVGPSAVVLRALDGTEVAVPVDAGTRVRLNGRAATLAVITPGLVAEAVRVGPGTAVAVRAFGPTSGRVETGRILRVRKRALVLRRGPGATVRIPVSARTVVWRGSRTAGVGALRPGVQVTIALSAVGSARVVLVEGSD